MSRLPAFRPLRGPRPSALACALAVAVPLALPALAQDVSGSGRFTPALGRADALYPQAPAATAAAPRVVDGRSGAVDYSANRAVDHVRVELDRDGVPADGQSTVHVRVALLGADGLPLAGQAFATIEHSGGRIRLPGSRTDEFGPGAADADKATPGIQLAVENGAAEFDLIAPHDPQDVLLRITAGGQSAEGVIGFLPEMRELLATGLIEGILNFGRKGNRDLIAPVERGDAFEREIRRWDRQFGNGKASASARTAFFVKGRIKGEYLLTAAYDSDKDLRSRLLRDVRPEEFYPVYGDSALRGFDARSAERLYVRVDHGRSYLLYGDFQTGETLATATGVGGGGPIPQRSLGTYNRTATGLGWHFESERVRGNVFAIQDSLRQVIDEFASQGSGPYALRNSAVLEGSERVEVVVRDRNQPSRIVEVRPLARLVDYSFEPFSGRILLNQFLPAFDANLDPVSLRVTYEMDLGTEKFWTYGADAQFKLTDKLEVGGSAVDDRNPFAELRMASLNAGYRFGANTFLAAEFARTRGEVNTNPVNQVATPGLAGMTGQVEGDAWRVEFGHEGEKLEARVFAARTDPAFNNPASPLYGGRGEYSARLAWKVNARFEPYVEALRSEDRNPDGGQRDAAGLGLRIGATEKLTVDLGLRSIRETVGAYSPWTMNAPFGSAGGLTGGLATGAGGGALGYGQQPLDPLTGLPVLGASGAQGEWTSSLPVGTELESDTARLGLGYKVSEKLSLGGEIEQEVRGEDRNRLALGMDYQVFERSRLYGRYEKQTGLTSAYGITEVGRPADAFVFGVDTRYVKDTQVFSEYRMRDAVNGRDLQAASGIRHTWDIAQGLRLSSSAEHVKVYDGATGDATGLAFGLDYTANPLWRGSARVEHRISGDVAGTEADEAFDTTLVQLLAARKLGRDWTVLARNYLLATDYRSRGDVLQDRFQVGLAYRDTDTNRINALARYEYKLERDESGLALDQGRAVDGTGQDVRTRAHIVSMHADWHPSRPWWLTWRVAGKWQQDRFAYADGGRVDSRFDAVLLSGRVVYDVTENWDIGALASTFRGQHGANQYAWGLEVGRLLRQNLWLSAGYNWTGFAGDRDLSGYEYTQQGAYLRLRFKFDEDLFRREQPRYREPVRHGTTTE
ncbi:hypothetical protein B1992_05870 [Pseudoxanthomonas broegbernensis]|uniref:TonB-dependent receptor n=1 Tax=Pseudoxanthomonas broegbernensis TaxID=83619 RepID=A0A7V8K7D3_9GAMM|nr:hypothetical protein [Pseudoxanthomonas broegbernensis]KAF1686916.1 hypothetical protein B1992_05870 [Pseudoxanthomonas broegbernensis]MBB6065487.1 hypothetical protein [Pseudoxanthomonas broegbernensis]